MELVNLTTGQVAVGPQLPAFGSTGCAVVHEGYLYWVRGWDRKETTDVYRANGKSYLGLCLVGSTVQLFLCFLYAMFGKLCTAIINHQRLCAQGWCTLAYSFSSIAPWAAVCLCW